MKIYLAIESLSDGDRVLGVFSTHDKAFEAIHGDIVNSGYDLVDIQYYRNDYHFSISSKHYWIQDYEVK